MIDGLDHLVLTVRSVDESCGFYVGVLGLRRVEEPGRPTSVQMGSQKINLHEVDRTFEPKAARPTPGSGDICLVTRHAIDDVVARLRAGGITVEVIRRPAIRHMSEAQLAAAVRVAEAIAHRPEMLADLNLRSLQWRRAAVRRARRRAAGPNGDCAP